MHLRTVLCALTLAANVQAAEVTVERNVVFGMYSGLAC
jgi:hypothetical protein